MRTVAVVGATGVVGREMVRMLVEREFPCDRIRLFASSRSVGVSVEVRGVAVPIEDTTAADLAGIDIAFFSAGKAASKALAPRFTAAGAFVIDNSSAFRQDPDVPLVVPEINPDALRGTASRVIANPNCTTIILLMALAPLHRRFGVERVIVSTYQAVSGAGKAALDELMAQVHAFAAGRPEPTEVYDRPIHLNLIPQIGALGPDGVSEEERKVAVETWKILGDAGIQVLATTVRVPVERCHSESVHATLRATVTRDEILAAWGDMPGLEVVGEGDPRRWPTPREMAGRLATAVGRLRADPYDPAAWMFWVVGDQLLKGAALNAIQIGELLVAEGRA